MQDDASIRFFEAQFQRQVTEPASGLNPFEQLALPHLRGEVLDYGCGLGHLAVVAARQGCRVTALDASPTAIGHLRQVAQAEGLPLHAEQADLRAHRLQGDYDVVVCIGLLMFFDCATALAQLQQLQHHVRPGGLALVNLLVQGTTYLDMFDPAAHCLLARDELQRRFDGWSLLHVEHRDFPAPGDTLKAFATVIARKPENRQAA